MKPNSYEVLLTSKKGIDYTNLNQLLAARQWKAADRETSRLMLEIIGKSNWYDVYPADIDKFPYPDLITIDQLWVKHSGGKFGFSAQKKIWLSVGGWLSADYETERKFAIQVGWRNKKDWLDYQQLRFNLDAPEGHLPLGCDTLRPVWCWALLNRLFARLAYYNLNDNYN